MNPLLRFDFKDYQGKENTFTFRNPQEIIAASTIDEVLHALQKVQDAVKNGYYAAGYLSYEAAPAFNRSFRVHTNQKMPLLWFGLFDQPVRNSSQSTKPFYTSKWREQTNIDTYNRNIAQIKQHIKQGDISQVNYTTQMESQFRGDSIAYYEQLAEAQSANYSAYLDIGDFTILSASPELFFHLKDNKITTKPMKGTIGRGKTTVEDQANAKWLYHSKKNRAENEMIVQMMQQELDTIAIPGTIKVPALFSIETYPTVYQMTSTVTADISPGKDITDIFKAMFPCGSITGSPKTEAINIIKDLESDPREIYCGAIGFITPEQEAIFNVPIRTVMIDNRNGTATYGAGGAITKDSTAVEEYEEVLVKARILEKNRKQFQLLESLSLSNGSYLLLENHLKRLKRSADFFQFNIDLALVQNKLVDFAKENDNKQWKVRLLVNENAAITLEANELSPISTPVPVRLASTPIDIADIFLYHKTTNRMVYEKRLNEFPGVFDVLLWNKKREVTEFTIGNIVVEIDGGLYTPPVECGLLAGTYRDSLIESGTISERKIMFDDLRDCTGIWLINSVRKWVQVMLSLEN